MANNNGHYQQSVPQATLLAVGPPSHGMQGLSSAAATRLLAAIARGGSVKDHAGAYDLGELEQPLGFTLGDESSFQERNSTFLPRVSFYAEPTAVVHFDSSNKVASPSSASGDSQSLPYSLINRGAHASFESTSSQRIDTWGESPMANNSPHTETSTDVEADRKTENQVLEGMQKGTLRITKNGDAVLAKNGDSKAQRRLAQNREAARKSRLRKKAYVQQLENSRMKLNQLEQELQRARQQGFFMSGAISGDPNHALGIHSMNGVMNTGAMAFDLEYARWLEEHNRQINDLRAAVHNHAGENDLRTIIDAVMTHYDEIFHLKNVASKADVFHLLSGMWKTPAERCFLWMGGHRPSEILKIIMPQVEPLTEQQVLGVCNLQQSSQQAEDALSQGMDSLQQSLAETLVGSLGTSGGPSGNVANYMGQMAMAMGRLGTFESFVRQADLLRQQTLQQLQRILTIRQSARALLVMNDYFSRLRALSSLWLARPRD